MDLNIQCGICYENLDDTKVKLKCGHEFHYECILFAYKSNHKVKNSYYMNDLTIRVCPYCRKDGGYLECKLKDIPLEYIHSNYEKFKESLKNNDKNYYMNYLDHSKCLSIIKTGFNKGTQCKFKPYCGSEFCKRHASKSL